MWPFKDKPLTEEVIIEKMNELLMVNSNASSDSMRGRMSQIISGSNFTGDTLHNIALDYGYPETLSFAAFWNMYRRFGIASGIIELPADASWMRDPTITSEDKRFLRDVQILIDKNKMWTRLKGLDTRQRVGRYAGLFMRVRDNMDPKEPLESKRLSGIGALVNMVPFYEGQLQVLETENDVMSDNYSLPTMYQFNGGDVGSRNERASASFSIHPSRIVIAAEGADNGGIYGISSLEAPYNSLMDLRKIIGGGAEGFYKNASQSIMFKLMDAASAKANAPLLEKFSEKYDDFARNRFRRAMWTPGLEPEVLSSELISPKEFFGVAMNDVAAASKIPATIITGQQTGRLASNEDSRSFLSGINSRNNNFVTDMITDTLKWCINVGLLPQAKFEVEWDDLMALSQKELLELGLQMADINSKQFLSGGGAAFSEEEIREASGFDPEEDVEPGGETDDDDLD